MSGRSHSHTLQVFDRKGEPILVSKLVVHQYSRPRILVVVLFRLFRGPEYLEHEVTPGPLSVYPLISINDFDRSPLVRSFLLLPPVTVRPATPTRTTESIPLP